MEYSKNNIDIKYKKNTHLIYDMVKTKIDDNMPIGQASFRFLTHKKKQNGVIHARHIWKGRYPGHQPKSYFSLMKDNLSHG